MLPQFVAWLGVDSIHCSPRFGAIEVECFGERRAQAVQQFDAGRLLAVHAGDFLDPADPLGSVLLHDGGVVHDAVSSDGVQNSIGGTGILLALERTEWDCVARRRQRIATGCRGV